MEIKKVVIIEDDIDLLNIISDLCKKNNFDCYEFRTFEDFIYKYSHIKPDLIITDLNLPGQSGKETIKSIRLLNKRVPIIMISGSQSSDDNVEALNLGANDFIIKPFNFDVFFAKIKNLLKKPEAEPINEIYFFPDQKLIKKNKIEVSLTAIESKIFEALFKLQHNFATREELHKCDKSRSLDVHINNLRKKISLIDLEINAIRNKGYRLKELGT
jgi:DNA-binding response OmpR family regulator